MTLGLEQPEVSQKWVNRKVNVMCVGVALEEQG